MNDLHRRFAATDNDPLFHRFALRLRVTHAGFFHGFDCRSSLVALIFSPVCSHTPISPAQIPRLRPHKYALLPKHERTVNRAYGGSRCAHCTRDRILRAFIIEEQKIVKQVWLDKLRAGKKAESS